jgi:hypothetical protein
LNSRRFRPLFVFFCHVLTIECAPDCTGFCSALHRRLEVGLGDLKVVLRRDRRAVADPLRDHVERVLTGEFSLAARAQVLEQPVPGRQAGPVDDPLELGPQIHRAVAGAVDHVDGAGARLFVQCFDVRPEFGEERHPPLALGLGVLELGRVNLESVAIPENVSPLQREQLGRASQAAVAAQGHDGAPLGVGTGI